MWALVVTTVKRMSKDDVDTGVLASCIPNGQLDDIHADTTTRKKKTETPWSAPCDGCNERMIKSTACVYGSVACTLYFVLRNGFQLV